MPGMIFRASERSGLEATPREAHERAPDSRQGKFQTGPGKLHTSAGKPRLHAKIQRGSTILT